MKTRKIIVSAMTAFLVALGLSVGSGHADQLSPTRETTAVEPAPAPAPTPVAAPAIVVVPAVQQISFEEYYKQVWKTAKENFLYQDRLTNFDQWEHKFDGKLLTQADAEKAINEMLDSMGDGYTYFRNNTRTQTQATKAASTNVVSYRMIGTVGYIKIETFGSNNAASETEAALNALNKAGAKSYILDLRDNGGGYVHQAFSIAAMFLNEGEYASAKGTKNGKPYLWEMTITKTGLEEKEGGSVTATHTRVANLTGKKPVVMLVNGGSASASEMLAGALRDHGRATLVGTKTFGKGISQLNLDLPFSTSMQITFSKLYHPKGATIHGVGMNPDEVVAVVPNADSQLTRAIELATGNKAARP